MEILEAINQRYTELSDSDCCLSCGKALQFAGPAEGETCVDLGSGRGNDTIRMAEMVGEEGFAYGIDLSDGMIEKAKRNAQKLNVSNTDFLQSDLETIPLKCGTVDLVISNCVLNHVRNKDKVWGEIHRILKTGGRFVISDIYSTRPVPEKYANNPQAIAECWAGAVTREEYMNLLKEAGFKQVKVLEESKPYDKGEIQVVSYTLTGFKTGQCSCR